MTTSNNKKITNLTDGEFLSFLYSERDRENSLRQYQGWNIWALVGALVAVICAGYQLLKDNINTIQPIQICYYSSVILAFVLCIHPLLTLWFRKDRGVDLRKLKRLGQNTPYYYLVWGIVLSLAFAVTIPLTDVSSRWNVSSVTWMIVLALFVLGTVSAFINREKEINSIIQVSVFTNYKWNIVFESVISGLLWLIVVYSYRKTPKFEIGNSNLELAVCGSVVVVLSYYLVKVFFEERKANEMDVLIDEYLYKGLPKEKVYERLLHERMGYRVIESFFKEIDEIEKTIKSYEQNKSEIEEVDKLLNNEKVDANKIGKCFEKVFNTLSYLRESDKRVRAINDKLKQIAKQAPMIDNDEEFKALANLITSVIGRIEELVRLTEGASKKIDQWIKENTCEKYGGLCTRECKHRHEKREWKFWRYWRFTK